MKRRSILVLGALAMTPSGVAAQSAKVWRIGILETVPTELNVRNYDALRQGLRERGYVEGQNLTLDYRTAEGQAERFPALARELVASGVDLIVTRGTPAARAAKEATSTVPIVMAAIGEPLGVGVVASLARPGGNVTGFASLEHSVIGKMLQTLKELAPSITRVAMLYNPDNVGATLYVRSFEAAAPPLGVQAILSPIPGLADIERVVVAVAAQPNGGIFVAPDVTTGSLMEQVVALITSHRLPAIYWERFAIAHGGLAFYGVDRIELYRGAASYVDRILRGEKSGDLPYQQPTKYELVINRKAAAALGLEIPPRLLFTADEVIE